MIQNNYTTKTDLEKDLVTTIVHILNLALDKKGTASILFSGGSTPKGLLNQLAKTALDWKNIKIGLVDDRMVERINHCNKNNGKVVVEKWRDAYKIYCAKDHKLVRIQD